ncbi:unnamed protein product [Mesocestoides corti]|uniref:Uncharacterized protein n=1 Tax=Mesocestoides corti TaxID=53468 RepID=A0A0R3U5Y0_MESCO|nr:unnamed protein product [Mesocestoides corti]
MASTPQHTVVIQAAPQPIAVRPEVGCCHKASLCCCRCYLGVSVFLSVSLFVAGGVLAYVYRGDIRGDPVYENRVMWGYVGVALLGVGTIMLIIAIINASCVCCLTPNKRIVQPNAFTVAQQPQVCVPPPRPPPPGVASPAAQMPSIPPTCPPEAKAPPLDSAPPPYKTVEEFKGY